MKIVVTIKTPSDHVASPVGGVGTWLKELINNHGKPRSREESLLDSLGLSKDSTYRGYECISAEPYKEPVPPPATKSIFDPIPGNSIVGPGGAILPAWQQSRTMTSKIWKRVRWVVVALFGVIVDRVGAPALHWVFMTLAHYVR